MPRQRKTVALSQESTSADDSQSQTTATGSESEYVPSSQASSVPSEKPKRLTRQQSEKIKQLKEQYNKDLERIKSEAASGSSQESEPNSQPPKKRRGVKIDIQPIIVDVAE